MSRTKIRVLPQRITEAREARKLNITQLADLVQVTRQAISRYENGLAQPSESVVSRLSGALDFPLGFFYKPAEMATADGVVFFRTFKSSEATERRMLEVKLKWVREACAFLEASLHMPPLNLPSLDFVLQKDHLADADIDQFATITRRHWNLGNGPIDNLAHVLEKNGIVLSGLDVESEKTDACSSMIDGTAVILYNKKLRSASRIRFSLAHELAHILLHGHITAEDLKDKKVLDEVESEANRFAGAFLLPSDAFTSDVHSLSLQSFVFLKEKWQVSIGAMLYRCHTLDLLDEETYGTLNRQLSFKRWRKIEPLDDAIAIEQPRLLRSALEFLIEKSVVGARQVHSSFLWRQEDIVNIFGLPDNFFCENSDMRPYLRLLQT